jgi:hypothetical protein
VYACWPCGAAIVTAIVLLLPLGPKAFSAITENVYDTPIVNPDIAIGEEVPVAVDTAPEEAFNAITVNCVTLPPPVSEEAVKAASPVVLAESNVGALGTCIGS